MVGRIEASDRNGLSVWPTKPHDSALVGGAAVTRDRCELKRSYETS
jgi:hypothetical protein